MANVVPFISKTIAARHRWGQPSRPSELRTERACVNCAIVRVTRHEGARHWVEFCNDAGMVITDGSARTTPACEQLEVGFADVGLQP